MKAVYYCRVSTEEESQINALEVQIEEAEKCIQSMGWILEDKYVDEGKTGTTSKMRNEYNRLLNDISKNKFDVIVIKSQDRLMRNVKEWYFFIDLLVSHNKKLYFYLENKYYTPDDALITGIKAILAEEYSRDLSKKINNAHKNRQIKGQSILITSATWGYDKVNKQVVINEGEAEIVKLIYNLCISGYGSRSISKELSNRGIKSRTGKQFAEITIRKILRNPLYKGTVVMNKRHFDFNTKKMLHVPQDEWIIHENAVPAIVTKEIWEEANKIMDSRAAEIHADDFTTKKIGKKLGHYNLSSKIFCGECGQVYWRRYRRRYKNKEEIIVDWSCSEYVKRGRKSISKANINKQDKLKVKNEGSGCDNIHLHEADLEKLLINIANDIFGDRKQIIIDHAMLILKDVLSNGNIEKDKMKLAEEKSKIIRQKELLLDKLLDGVISDEDYKRKVAALDNKLSTVTEKDIILIEKETQMNDINTRLDDIRDTLNGFSIDLTNVAKLIKHIVKIVVFHEHLEIYFDFYQSISVKINQLNNSKKYLYVDTDKNLAAINN